MKLPAQVNTAAAHGVCLALSLSTIHINMSHPAEKCKCQAPEIAATHSPVSMMPVEP